MICLNEEELEIFNEINERASKALISGDEKAYIKVTWDMFWFYMETKYYPGILRNAEILRDYHQIKGEIDKIKELDNALKSVESKWEIKYPFLEEVIRNSGLPLIQQHLQTKEYLSYELNIIIKNLKVKGCNEISRKIADARVPEKGSIDDSKTLQKFHDLIFELKFACVLAGFEDHVEILPDKYKKGMRPDILSIGTGIPKYWEVTRIKASPLFDKISDELKELGEDFPFEIRVGIDSRFLIYYPFKRHIKPDLINKKTKDWEQIQMAIQKSVKDILHLIKKGESFQKGRIFKLYGFDVEILDKAKHCLVVSIREGRLDKKMMARAVPKFERQIWKRRLRKIVRDKIRHKREKKVRRDQWDSDEQDYLNFLVIFYDLGSIDHWIIEEALVCHKTSFDLFDGETATDVEDFKHIQEDPKIVAFKGTDWEPIIKEFDLIFHRNMRAIGTGLLFTYPKIKHLTGILVIPTYDYSKYVFILNFFADARINKPKVERILREKIGIKLKKIEIS